MISRSAHGSRTSHRLRCWTLNVECSTPDYFDLGFAPPPLLRPTPLEVGQCSADEIQKLAVTTFTCREDRDLPLDQLIALYRANAWSSADKGEVLRSALLASHSLTTAWAEGRLIGLGNALSDGYLVVYYPHLIVLPEFQGKGVGTEIMRRLKQKYETFHMQMLVADGRAIDFYEKCGFQRAGQTEPMWIYAGHDH